MASQASRSFCTGDVPWFERSPLTSRCRPEQYRLVPANSEVFKGDVDHTACAFSAAGGHDRHYGPAEGLLVHRTAEVLEVLDRWLLLAPPDASVGLSVSG
jgi:hypothetical protein